MLKKMIMTVLSLSMVISLAACGNSSKNSDTTGTGSQSASASSSSSSVSSQSASSSDDGESNSAGTSAAEVTPDSGSEVLLGGWNITQGSLAPADNPDAKEAFDKALEGLTGCDYDMIAVLGSQVVAGTNYSYLCRETIVDPDAESDFAILNVYEDLDGNAEITGVRALPLITEDGAGTSVSGSSVSGSSGEADAANTATKEWTFNQDDTNPDASNDVKNIFEKATADDSSASYNPIAYIASRGSGVDTEYAVFCSMTEGGTATGFCIISVKADDAGSASIADITNVDLSAV